MLRSASEAMGLANTIRELGHEARVRSWLSTVGAAPSNPAEGEKPRSSGSKRFVVQSILPTLLARHLDGKRLATLCDFWNIKHVNGRPNSAPKLPTDTEYITRVTLQTKLLCLPDRNAESGSMKWLVGRALDGLSRVSILLVFWCIWSRRSGTVEKLLRQSAAARKLWKKGVTGKTSQRLSWSLETAEQHTGRVTAHSLHQKHTHDSDSELVFSL